MESGVAFRVAVPEGRRRAPLTEVKGVFKKG